MLFHASFRLKPGATTEDQKKMLDVWARWQPPEGYEIKYFWMAPDGRGFAIVDALTAEALYEAVAPWATVIVEYDFIPIVDVEIGAPLMEKGIAFREG
jgi:hypothetical protein